ncbi:MAG: PD40 domain-containing protein [Chloroflexi bacterium]|nr:PD40 domain-containing protein [Chloroflexota bacterium]
MYSKSKFVLINFVLAALLSLISCTVKSITAEPTLILSSTPSLSILPTLISSTATYKPTSTAIPSTLILPSPTETPLFISNGRILFVGNSIKDDVNSNGLVLLNLKSNESILVVHKNQELNGQTLLLSYPNITWSPDGHWIAFIAINTENNFFWHAQEDIYIVKSDGTELRRLTYSPRHTKRDIAWSPDGQYILVAMGINGSDLYLVDAVNGEIAKRLTSSGNNYMAVWSPDGDKIAYLEDLALSIMNVTDKTSQQISIPSNHHILGISWSPNNEQIAFVSSVDNSKCGDIFTVAINTGEITNLTSSKYYERYPDWLPDGNHLVFSRSVLACDEMVGPGDWDIFITNPVSEEHKIVSDTSSETTIAWSPVPNLEIGKQYTITELGAFLNLRTEPSLNGKILEKLPAGEVVTVLDGFVDMDDYYWWKIQTQDGIEGWAVEVANWYKLLTE